MDNRADESEPAAMLASQDESADVLPNLQASGDVRMRSAQESVQRGLRAGAALARQSDTLYKLIEIHNDGSGVLAVHVVVVQHCPA